MPRGSTGEFASLSPDQRRAVVETVADAAGDAPVIAGCGVTSVPEKLSRIADDAGLPIMLYNNPRTAQARDAETVTGLAANDGIVGVKDSSGDPLLHRVVAADTPDSFGVVQGAEAQSVGGLDTGADGLVPRMANVVPAVCAELYEAYRAGDRTAAVARQNEMLLPLIRAVVDRGAPGRRDQHLAGPATGTALPPSARLVTVERRDLEAALSRLPIDP